MIKTLFIQMRTAIHAVAVVLSAGAIVSCDSSALSSADDNVLEYLAVKKDAKDNWSIIDRDGKVVVDQEYAADDTVSIVYEGGVYWVRSGEKIRLFSIDSPKKAISEGEYDDVTNFSCGRAFVSNLGEPIILIGSDGKHIKTLDRTVVEVCAYSDGLALFKSQDGRWGYLDSKGDVAVRAIFDDAFPFNNGYAFAVKGKNACLINKNGDVVTAINSTVYTPRHKYAEGKMGVVKSAGNGGSSVTYLDKDGKELFCPLKGFSNPMPFNDGYAVLENYVKDGPSEYAVINDKGETVIRRGKYTVISHIHDGLFIVVRGEGQVGIVDKDDNQVVKCEYSDGLYRTLGDHFIMKSGRYWVLVDQEGKEVKNTEFYACSGYQSKRVRFIDVKAHVDNFLKSVTAKGYAPLKGHLDAAGFAKAMGLALDSVEAYSSSVERTAAAGPLSWETLTVFEFDGSLKTVKYREETTNDGWFESTNVVEDGYQWNPDCTLWKISLKTMPVGVKRLEDVRRLVTQALKAKGFKQDGDSDSFDAKVMGRTIHISVEYDENYDLVDLSYYPNWNE